MGVQKILSENKINIYKLIWLRNDLVSFSDVSMKMGFRNFFKVEPGAKGSKIWNWKK